ncbi:MAG TPA: glycosyltransferase family 2 protein, partial [Mycobacteriales bacterium]|nr:glycosyltransferase family 2 protein [Mycobacteriales bacterium]
MSAQTGDFGRLVCLLPVRNGSTDLPEWLASVRLFCDDVVALDDGSTDDTATLLKTDPLVRVVLSNPPRPTTAGWHDGQNRNRLLAAAADLDPHWVLFLDVDERLDGADAQALRVFVDCDAIPGFAYGLQHFRMWFGRNGDHLYDPE